MKNTLANTIRAEVVSKLLQYMTDCGEDCGLTASNTFNFPVTADGEEGFVEVVVKVVKKESDECYQERIDYVTHLKEKAEKKAEREREAAEKKAKAEAKKKEKEAKQDQAG